MDQLFLSLLWKSSHGHCLQDTFSPTISDRIDVEWRSSIKTSKGPYKKGSTRQRAIISYPLVRHNLSKRCYLTFELVSKFLAFKVHLIICPISTELVLLERCLALVRPSLWTCSTHSSIMFSMDDTNYWFQKLSTHINSITKQADSY